jgi:GNAT superfamily N-acetyltransferase
MQHVIRAPVADELALLREIERAAGVMFARVGLDDVAAHEPATIGELAEYLRDGRVWILAVDDTPVGYALLDLVDENAHLEQLSVLPEHGQRGLGSMLLEHVCAWAAAEGFPAVTLTTFSHVNWNQPFYEHRGFRVLAEREIGPELRALRDEETAHGLDPALRVCMRRDVKP